MNNIKFDLKSVLAALCMSILALGRLAGDFAVRSVRHLPQGDEMVGLNRSAYAQGDNAAGHIAAVGLHGGLHSMVDTGNRPQQQGRESAETETTIVLRASYLEFLERCRTRTMAEWDYHCFLRNYTLRFDRPRPSSAPALGEKLMLSPPALEATECFDFVDVPLAYQRISPPMVGPTWKPPVADFTDRPRTTIFLPCFDFIYPFGVCAHGVTEPPPPELQASSR
jgi:hypothetical protein